MSQYLLYTYKYSSGMFLSKVEPIQSIDRLRITDIWAYPDNSVIDTGSFSYSSDLRHFNILAKFDYPIPLNKAKRHHPELFT